MAIKLPLLDRTIRIADKELTPSLPFHQWWQRVVRAIESALNSLEGSVVAIEAALEAAGIAIAAAETAQAAAESAQAVADGATAVSKLSGSGISGGGVTATDAGTDVTITIAAHTRSYSDGTSVSVSGGSFTGQAYSTTYYIYYDDATYADTTPTYQITTNQATAIQTGVRHLVAQVLTPAAGQPPEDGLRPRPPGFGNLEEQQ